MSFQNEYVPTFDAEKSEFFRKAMEILQLENAVHAMWTVDRESQMALYQDGTEREPGPIREDFWTFIDTKGVYAFKTARLQKKEKSPDTLEITYELKHYRVGYGRSTPDRDSLVCIKAALREYRDWGVISDYKHCELTLIDGATGKEVQ